MITVAVLVSIAMPFVYKYLVPLFSRGGVQFELRGVRRCLIFGVAVTLTGWLLCWWGVFFFGQAVVGLLYETLKPIFQAPPIGQAVGLPVLILLVGHTVFFALTLVMSKFAIIKAERESSIWFAAWAPVSVIALLLGIYYFWHGVFSIP